jgi:y4mF family transcriptional regulator
MVHIHNTHELGETLLAARKRLGLTQPQLAMAAGVGVRFMVDLEAGKPTLRLASVLSVIDALGGTLAIHGLAPSSPAPEGNDHGA